MYGQITVTLGLLYKMQNPSKIDLIDVSLHNIFRIFSFTKLSLKIVNLLLYNKTKQNLKYISVIFKQEDELKYHNICRTTFKGFKNHIR